MNPNNGQTPLDYLNQIAPQAPKSRGFTLNIKSVLVIGVVLIILVIILANIVSSAGSSRKNGWIQLTARLSTTQVIAESSTPLLKSSQLRSLNTDLKLYLSNTQRDLTAPLLAQDINIEKLPEKIVTAENGAEMNARLEDGRLNAKFDSTYAREMSFQLATVLALYQELYSSARDDETKAFLDSAYKNLLPTQQSLDSFNATNE